jgi:pimeloyl-ACP methyl ester carboxylesterase
MAEGRTPVVFVHGLWLHASSWGPWLDLFRENGYEPFAPGWPGDADTVEETRANPERVAGFGINAVVDHYTQEIAGLDTKPIAIGHSFGGIIVQRLLAQGLAAAAVAIDPAPIKGVLALPPSSFKVASVGLRSPSNKHKAVALTREQFRYGFGNALSEQESNELYDRWAIPSPGLPLFEAAFAAFSPHSPAKVDTRNSSRGPLLVTAGGRDHTVPAAISRSTVKLYRHSAAITDHREFPDRGHSLTIDSRWPEVADAVLHWFRERGLAGG